MRKVWYATRRLVKGSAIEGYLRRLGDRAQPSRGDPRPVGKPAGPVPGRLLHQRPGDQRPWPADRPCRHRGRGFGTRSPGRRRRGAVPQSGMAGPSPRRVRAVRARHPPDHMGGRRGLGSASLGAASPMRRAQAGRLGCSGAGRPAGLTPAAGGARRRSQCPSRPRPGRGRTTQNPPNNQESQCVHHHHHDDSATQQPSWSPQVTEKLHPTRDEDVRATLALGQTFVHAG